MVEREGALTVTTRRTAQKPAEAVEPGEAEMDGVGEHLPNAQGVEVHAVREVVDFALAGPGQAVIAAAATLAAAQFPDACIINCSAAAASAAGCSS